MSSELPEIDRAYLALLASGAAKIFDNAEKLFWEADLLNRAGATARALCLHQISLEECSKIERMGAWAMCHLVGHQLEQRKLVAALRRHDTKNKTNAYMLTGTVAEQEAKERGDWKTAIAEFQKFQKKFHEQSNSAKNAALYVDWIGAEFVSPQDKITSEMLVEIAERNSVFLGIAANSLKLLQRLESSPDVYQQLVVPFVAAAKNLPGDDPNKAAAGMQELIDKLMSDGTEKLAAQRAIWPQAANQSEEP